MIGIGLLAARLQVTEAAIRQAISDGAIPAACINAATGELHADVAAERFQANNGKGPSDPKAARKAMEAYETAMQNNPEQARKSKELYELALQNAAFYIGHAERLCRSKADRDSLKQLGSSLDGIHRAVAAPGGPRVVQTPGATKKLPGGLYRTEIPGVMVE